MPRYINTDALEVVVFTDQEGSFSDGIQWLLEYIDKLPSADAVEVVQCKDCNDYQPNFGWCKLHDGEMLPTDYCSYGERVKNG